MSSGGFDAASPRRSSPLRAPHEQSGGDGDVEQRLQQAEVAGPVREREIVSDPVREAEDTGRNRRSEDGRRHSMRVIPECSQPYDAYGESEDERDEGVEC